MQKRSIAVTLASVLAVFVLTVAPAAVARAEEGTGSATGTTTKETNRDGSVKDNANTGASHTPTGERDTIQKSADSKEGTSTSGEVKDRRFDTRKLHACENRKGKITSIIDRAVTRSQNQIDLFDKIVTRTKAFYVSKGKTLDTYGDLVAAVDAAKAKAEADLSTVKANSAFKCDDSDPQGDIDAFKAAVKQEIQDLKAYRTAIKNLIVGVKSVQGDAS